jgi:capsular exopolysaccharide synthesis family protein
MSRVEEAFQRLRQSELTDAPQEERQGSPLTTQASLARYPREGRHSHRPVSDAPIRPPVAPADRHGVDTADQLKSGGPAGGNPASAGVEVVATDHATGQAAHLHDTQFDQTADSGSANPTTVLWSALNVAIRRKWLILAAFTVVASASVLYLRTIVPVFRATTKLTVELRNPSDALLKQTTENGPQQGYVETLAEVLRSRWLAETTAAKLELWNHPEYRQAAGGTAPTGAESGEGAPPGVVDRFMANTAVVALPGSNVISVSFTATDPQLAATAANVLAKGFISRDLESRLSGAKDATDWIGRRLEEQRARVTETETALQRYRERQNAASLDDRQNLVVQRLGELNSAVTKARTERIAKQELYKRVIDLQSNQNQLDSVPSVAANGYIQQLKSQLDQADRQLTELAATFGDRHPEIIRLKSAREDAARRLDAEIGTVAASMRNEFLTAQDEEQSLTRSLEAQKREAQDLDRKAVEYAALTREAESNRGLYQSLLEQAKNVSMSGDLQRSNVRILDEARLPPAPIGPVGRAAKLLALLTSAAFAIGLAFVLEYMSPRIRTLDQVPEQLNLPLLGHLESVRGTTGDPSRALISADTPARFNEQVRRIRTNLEIEAGTNGGVVLMASASPKEGKTLVSSNLALALAVAGRQVLLIDCDLRRSQVHSVFGVPLEPGLSTLLQSPRVDLDEGVCQGPVPTLWLLPAGAPALNPSELLGSARFAALVQAARSSYDWVVIDSPPLMAVSDAHLLARLADQMVFVACADQTRRNTARLAIAQLRRAPARLLGVVLNRVTIPRWGSHYSAYFGGGCDSYYQPNRVTDTAD